MTEVLHDTFHCQGETDSVIWAKKMTHEQTNRRPPKCLVYNLVLPEDFTSRGREVLCKVFLRELLNPSQELEIGQSLRTKPKYPFVSFAKPSANWLCRVFKWLHFLIHVKAPTMLSSPWRSSLCLSVSTLFPRGVWTLWEGVGHPLLPLLPWRSNLAWLPSPTLWRWSDRGAPSRPLTVETICRPFSDLKEEKISCYGSFL